MRWCIFGTDFFVCDCEKLKMYWMYIEFFGKKQAGKDVSKMCRRINQWFLNGMRGALSRQRCRLPSARNSRRGRGGTEYGTDVSGGIIQGAGVQA